MVMVRFTEFTVGPAWKSDYGDPKNAGDFKALYAYSPLHNIKPGVPFGVEWFLLETRLRES